MCCFLDVMKCNLATWTALSRNTTDGHSSFMALRSVFSKSFGIIDSESKNVIIIIIINDTRIISLLLLEATLKDGLRTSANIRKHNFVIN